MDKEREDRMPYQGSVLMMAYAIAEGRTYTTEDGVRFTPQEAMSAAGLADRIADAERIARERFGWGRDTG